MGRRRAAFLLAIAASLVVALAAAPSSPAKEHPYNKGCRLLTEDRYKAAAREFTKALQISPEDTDALNNLAVCNILLGKHAAAHRQLKKALELNPRYAGARLNIGADEIIRERPELALPPTVKASKAEGGSAAAVTVRASAQYNLGLIALMRGDAKAARQAFAASAKIKKTPEAVLGAGVAACVAGDYDTAVETFQKAADAGGALGRMARIDLAAAYYSLGTEEFAAGALDAARRSLQQSQDTRASDAALIGLALVDAESGDVRKAVATLQAVEETSRSKEMRQVAAIDIDRVLERADRRSAWVKWLAVGLGVVLLVLLVVGFVRARGAPSWKRPGAFLSVVTILMMPLTVVAAALVFVDPLRTPQQLAVVAVLDAVVLFFLWRRRTA